MIITEKLSSCKSSKLRDKQLQIKLQNVDIGLKSLRQCGSEVKLASTEKNVFKSTESKMFDIYFSFDVIVNERGAISLM